MSYTPQSSVVGYRNIAQGWGDTLRAHGAVPDVVEILRQYDDWCDLLDLDANILLAQACHESTYFRSIRWLDEFNPAGLGVTADNTPPHPFRDYREGIAAHCQHMCCYVYTAAGCPVGHGDMADRRHVFHDGIPTLEGLIRQKDDPRGERRWANPGTGYINSIVNIVNKVVGAEASQPLGGVVQEPWDRTHWAADVGPERVIDAVKWFVVHDTEGRFAGDESVLTSGGGPVESVHFLVGREQGQCVYMVPLNTTAWTAGNDLVGEQAIQVELSQLGGEGYTEYQYLKLAEIFNWCVGQGMKVPPVYIGRVDADGGPEPDIPGIIGHQDVPDGRGGWGGSANHTDPGPLFDWDKFISCISSPVAVPQPVARRFQIDGYEVGEGIYGIYHAVPADIRMRLLGFCRGAEQDGKLTKPDGTRQSIRYVPFERQRIIWDRGTSPAPWDTRAPLLTEEVS